jgi:hypothetical protein
LLKEERNNQPNSLDIEALNNWTQMIIFILNTPLSFTRFCVFMHTTSSAKWINYNICYTLILTPLDAFIC